MNVKAILSAVLAAAAMLLSSAVNVYADTVRTDGMEAYRYSDDGSLMGKYSGWTCEGGKRYYYRDGKKLRSCWLTVNGERKYYLLSDGSAAVGKATLNGIEYEFDENGVLVKNVLGIDITIEDVTAEGLTIVCTQSGGNPSGNEMFTGSYYVVETLTETGWQEVTPIVDEVCWTEEAWIIEMGGTYRWKTNWSYIYGTLSSGRYRIGKSVMDFRGTGDHTSYMCYGYFEI